MQRIRKWLGDKPLWALLTAFLSWELFAHFTGNKSQHTLSNRFWALEKKYHFTKILVGAGGLYLTGHLVFQWPL